MERDHLTDSEWTAYRERTLPAAALLAVSDHLAACADCAAKRAEIAAPFINMELDELDAAPESYEEIVAWVDGTMTDPVDREIFEARLAVDPQLGMQVADLAAFKGAMARLPAQEYGETTTPSNIVAFPTRAPARWFFPLTAAAAVVFAMILWSALQPAQHNGVTVASAELARAVDAALAAGKLALPPLPPELRRERGTLAGAAEEGSGLAVIQPHGQVVRNRLPRLVWDAKAPVDHFVVQLQRVADGALISSPALPATAREWRPPEPLTPGAIYEWQVQALRGGETVDQAPRPPEPEARFQVVEATHEAELRAAEKGQSELQLGMAYARAGMRAEADAHWKAAGTPDAERLRAMLR